MPKVPVFLSFSGPRSRAVATALRTWLPDVLQAVEPWTSTKDIDAGERWGLKIGAQLQNTNIGVICLTPENVQPAAAWIMFEAGALSKSIDTSKVICLCCFGVDFTKHVPSPLNEFQNKKADDQRHILELVSSINRELGEHALTEGALERQVARCWDDWEQHLHAAKETEHEKVDLEEPKPADVMSEILQRLKTVERKLDASRPRVFPEGVLTGSPAGPDFTSYASHLQLISKLESEKTAVDGKLANMFRDAEAGDLENMRMPLRTEIVKLQDRSGFLTREIERLRAASAMQLSLVNAG